MGFLPEAMVNYLALLGWNDGSEDEIFSKEEIVKKFTIDRITKSAAIFDQAKLRWMNGQHLRTLPADQLYEIYGDRWFKAGILCVSMGPFVNEAAELLKNGIDVVSDADAALIEILSYPIQSTLQSTETKEIVLDNLKEVVDVLVAAHGNGDLISALDAGHEGWQNWIRSIGKLLKRKGKRLFMPVRVLLTGKMHGPDIGSAVLLIHKAQKSGAVNLRAGLIPISGRIEMLKEVDWDQIYGKFSQSSNSVETVPTLLH
ncbi:hypothetical protein O6H91_15G014800 [Diphasiastrum complanatum]|nr:hypothetical protein O6H91_15G014800 [Diphasiastrum complanatum]